MKHPPKEIAEKLREQREREAAEYRANFSEEELAEMDAFSAHVRHMCEMREKNRATVRARRATRKRLKRSRK